MRMRTFRVLSVAVWIWIAAASASAGDFTFFVGGDFPGKLSESIVLGSLSSYDTVDKSPVYGFRLSTSFVPMVGLEHTLAFSNDYLFPNANFFTGVTNARGFIYNSNLIINFPSKSIVPYATAGIGLLHQYGSENLPVGTKLAFNYGGGLKFLHVLGPLGVRFDARGYTSTGLKFGGHLNIFELSGGVLLSF